jgi:hypothetical protein
MRRLDQTARIYRGPSAAPVSPPFFYGPSAYGQDTRRHDDRPTLMMHTDDSSGRPPVVPGAPWADLVAPQDQPPLSPAETYLHVQHGWDLPGQEPERPSRMLVYLLVALMILVALLAIGFTLQRQNVLPAGVPILGKDSGVAACQQIANGATPTGMDANAEFTAADYRKARQVFADSRYPAIRDNGTRLLDLAWQIGGAAKSSDDLAGALMFMNELSQAYTGLAGGCADHGITIPAMTGGN